MGQDNNNYTILHLHTMLSNATTTIDSVTKFTEYISKAKECDMKAMAFSEHGSVFEWYHKKQEIEKVGMKYIHACEVYITQNIEEKIRDNFHCLLICKNYEGVKELNNLISNSFNRNDGHYYYTPRITYEELKSTSDNIIISTACVGGILGKGNDEIKDDFLKFLSKNNSRCYLEIQHHLVDTQVEYNKYLIELSKQYNIPLLACTDTHCLNNQHVKGRSILQKSKNIYFEDEDGWDLTFKTYDELCECFNKQGIDNKIYLQALENTNIIAEQVEEFTLDTNTKYPKIYDNSVDTFKQKINKAYKENPYIKERYTFEKMKKVLHEEADVYEKTKSIDFMLMQAYLREWEKENGIQCGYGRGSVSGSFIAYLLGITQMDSLKFGLNFFRFQNPSRVSNCDIDTDYNSTDREKIKRFLLEDHMDIENIQCSEIVTFNTIALKGAIKDVCRALSIPLDEAQEISDAVYLDDNKKWCIGDEWKEKYPEVFEYAEIVNGTVVSIGSHPSGVLVTDRDISHDIGTCTLSTSKYPVSMLNMKELDALMYVKLDLLGLDNLGVINESCKLLNIERLTPDNVDLDDEKVWDSIRDDTTLIFQWESDSAQAYLKKFMSDETIHKVRKIIKNFSFIKWFSFGNGLIRPACANYRNEVAQGIFYDNKFKELDEFLSQTLGHVTMQEDIMQFLVKFCGYSDAESDNVRRGIAKKYGTEKLLPEIESRFIEYSSTHYNITKDECKVIIKPFLDTILQASSYAFSWNHSDAYSCIGYICGYLRYYYPLEFLTSSLNIFSDKEEKTLSISHYAKKVNIPILPPKFRHSKSVYMCDKETNSIYKGLASIKFLNEKIGEELYNLRYNNYESSIELLNDIKNKTSLNSKQLEILIHLNFFEEFGSINKLLYIVNVYNNFYKSKVLTKSKLTDYELECLNGAYGKSTEKQYRDIDNKKFIFNLINNRNYVESTNLQLIQYQINILGYSDIVDDSYSQSIYIVEQINLNQYGTPYISLYQPCSGISMTYKCDKKWYNEYKCEVGDVLECVIDTKEKRTKVDNKWVATGEYEEYIKVYCVKERLGAEED